MRQEALLVTGKLLFESPRLTMEEKARLFALSYRKLLFLTQESSSRQDGDGQVDDLPADQVGLGLFGPGELVHRQIDLKAQVPDGVDNPYSIHQMNHVIFRRAGEAELPAPLPITGAPSIGFSWLSRR